MGRSRYHFAAPDQPHFLTCTVLHWIPVFTRPETVQILLDSLHYLQKIEYIHNNPVERGYVDRPEHWWYSSARDYLGQEGLLRVCRAW